MTRKFYGGVFLACLGLVLAYMMLARHDEPDVRDTQQDNVEFATAVPSDKPRRAPTGKSWGPSPFTTASRVDMAALARMRHEKMKALGYETPAKYYEMSLTQLTELAKKGDPSAMAQLAEQYYSEVEFIRGDPGFDRTAKPKEVAMKYFEGAFLAGYTRLASVVAMQMTADEKLVDAYAWNMIAQRFNDHTNDKLYFQSGTFAKMSDMDKAVAQGKMDAIWQRVVARAETVH